ncbi:MAG: hypothetical protein FWH12_07370 [Treponema sp.]|nr:hypothetical protein [Treponema sp.]
MQHYLKTVTLGAFTWKDEERLKLFVEHLRELKGPWLFLHFILLSICLNFPVIFAIAQLPPHELYGRLYGETYNFAGASSTTEFNMIMYESGYGANVLLPLLGLALLLVLIIQGVFYLSAVFFLGLHRLHQRHLSFRNRLGLALFSSTLPVLAAAFFGIFLPTVHIIIFYFMVMFFIFQRSRIISLEW